MSQTDDHGADWERYRAFLAVLREGSLSAAARALGMAQPTIRRRVEELERQVGTALFTRSPSGLEPTALSRELVAPAEAMAAAAAAFARTASAETGATSGVIRITASEVVGVEVLPRVLAELRAEHPGLVFELALTNRNEDLLRREADIAVRMVRPTQGALVARRVGTVELGLHAHRRVVEAWGQPASLAGLRHFPVIGFDRESPSSRGLRAHGLDLRREDFIFRTDGDLAHLAAIRAGIGFGVCQVAIGRRDADLLRILPAAFSVGLETWIVMHEDLRSVRRVKLAFDALHSALAAYVLAADRS